MVKMMADQKNLKTEELKNEKTTGLQLDKIVGKKIGMTQLFDKIGNVIPVTVIEAGPCFVTQIKTAEKDGYNAVQLGFIDAKKLNKPKAGHLKGKKCRYLREFRLETLPKLALGQELKVDAFNPGDVVEISGISIGKGFAGTVKKYHHGRGPMTHGSKSHRIPGSIGAGTTPGRVLKGRKMSGRMGGVIVLEVNLGVVQIDLEKNLLLVKGSVPGKAGNIVTINRVAVAKPIVGKDE